MDIGGIKSAIGAAGGILDIADRALGLMARLRGGAFVNKKEVEAATQAVSELKQRALTLEQALFSLQEDFLALQNANKALEKQIMQREERALRQIAGGAFVYVPNGVERADENGPWYCQPCHEDGKDAILQRAERKFGTDIYKCPLCAGAIQVPNDIKADIRTVRSSRRDRYEDF